jgi:hypothetical protein
MVTNENAIVGYQPSFDFTSNFHDRSNFFAEKLPTIHFYP